MGWGTWLNKKVVDPLLHILRRGAEPKQLAFSTALGMSIGVFFICGITVFLCGMAIALLGSHCHAPTVILANFIAAPIELSCWDGLLQHLLFWLPSTYYFCRFSRSWFTSPVQFVEAQICLSILTQKSNSSDTLLQLSNSSCHTS